MRGCTGGEGGDRGGWVGALLYKSSGCVYMDSGCSAAACVKREREKTDLFCNIHPELTLIVFVCVCVYPLCVFTLPRCLTRGAADRQRGQDEAIDCR